MEEEHPYLEEREAMMLNPLQLAYMGDSVWELTVRHRLVMQRKNVHHMHLECVQSVNAAAQSAILRNLCEYLTDTELSIVQRGRNAHLKHPAPRNQSRADYADSTCFEALIGYLFITGNRERLEKLFEIIFSERESTWQNKKN